MTGILEQFDTFRLEPLTPVHVGTGETLDPLAYIIKERDGNHYLHHIDLAAWVEDQPDPADLADRFASLPLPDIRAMIASKVDPETYGTAGARVVSEEIVKKYQKELGDRQSQNQLKLSPCMRNPVNGAPFIPGSSIKGAIRTAVIDWLDRECGLQLKEASAARNREYKQRLETALGEIRTNRFANLKVGDFQAGPGDCLVTTAKEARKKQKEQGNSTPKNDCEVLASRVLGADDGFALHGRMLLGAHGAGNRDKVLTVHCPGTGKPVSWDIGGLMQLCNEFYSKRFKEEWDRFYSQAHLAHVREALAHVRELAENPAPDVMLLRIGHYSHVECMTVTSNNPKTRPLRGGQGVYPYGTTRTLADGRYPFGWVLLRLCDQGEYRDGVREVERRMAEQLEHRESLRKKIAEKAAALEQERADRQRREREEREAKEKREAELASLSPEERLVVQLEAGELANENQVNEVYYKLDAMDDALRLRASRALKARWQQEPKKWSGKLSPKQKDKVKHIKKLLDEI